MLAILSRKKSLGIVYNVKSKLTTLFLFLNLLS
jgi:hypothetical protein